MKVYAIQTKNLGLDEFGVKRVIWATEQQADYLRKMFNNPKTRSSMVTIGKASFPVSDIVLIEERDRPAYDMPKYLIERADYEKLQSKSLTLGEK